MPSAIYVAVTLTLGGKRSFAKAANGLVRDAIADIRSGNACVPQTRPPEETV